MIGQKSLQWLQLNTELRFLLKSWSCGGLSVASTRFRKEKPEAYTPQLISIGPLHHNEEKLKPMEKQKKLYHHYFLSRLQDSHQEALTKFKTFIECEENHIRRCYSRKCDLSKEDLVEMILLDSVFMMELFLRNQIIQAEKDHLIQTEREKDLLNQIKKDLLFSKLWIAGGILRDLLLLENQLPMFVLIELYNEFVSVSDLDKQGKSFHKLACGYFKTGNQSFQRDHISESRLEMYKKSQHFVDLIRYRSLPYDQDYFKQRESSNGDLRTARKLNEAGITFEKIKRGPLLAVDFHKSNFLNRFPCLSTIPRMAIFKSRLIIPQLVVDDGTEILLRNLVAFEQCHYPSEAYICNYVDLMDCLIDTKEDVEFLAEMEVIVKNVGSNKEVANMFNSLCKEVHISSSGYADIIEKLNRHYEMSWNHNMAKLKSVYFCDLWRGSATVVGIAVFLFSVIDIVQNLINM